MRRNTLLLLCFCGILPVGSAVTLKAQEETSYRNKLELNIGPSIPYGVFALKDFSYQSGFAGLGLNTQFGLVHFTRREVTGFYAELDYANFFIDERSFVTAYEQVLVDEGEMRVTAGNYQFMHLHVGMQRRLPEVFGFRIVFKAGFGYALCMQPPISANHTYWGELNNVNRDFDMQLSSSAGVNLEYSLNRASGIQVAYSVFAAKPDFRDTVGYRARTFYQPVRYHNINIGITRYF